jgi:hypothetical protein
MAKIKCPVFQVAVVYDTKQQILNPYKNQLLPSVVQKVVENFFQMAAVLQIVYLEVIQYQLLPCPEDGGIAPLGIAPDIGFRIYSESILPSSESGSEAPLDGSNVKSYG